MNRTSLLVILFVLSDCLMVHADDLHSILDGGGGRSSAGAYLNDASIGAIGGMSDSGASTNRSGYVGQLTEIKSLMVAGTTTRVNESAATQLSGTSILSDGTVIRLTASDVQWGNVAWPMASISANGLATTANVYQDTPAVISGLYLSISSSASLLVLDSNPDNYSSYADDGLPDAWQYSYFGLDNPNAAPSADPTSCGQNNQFKYIAGLDPTNATSLFTMRIELAQGQPTQAKLIFTPRWHDRTYTPIFCTNLGGGSAWTNLLTTTVSDDDNERTLTDTNGVDNARFYRIKITYP